MKVALRNGLIVGLAAAVFCAVMGVIRHDFSAGYVIAGFAGGFLLEVILSLQMDKKDQ